MLQPRENFPSDRYCHLSSKLLQLSCLVLVDWLQEAAVIEIHTAISRLFPQTLYRSGYCTAVFKTLMRLVCLFLGWTIPPKWDNSLWYGKDWLRAVEGSLKWLTEGRIHSRDSYLFSAVRVRVVVPKTRKDLASVAVPLLFWTSPVSVFFSLQSSHSVFAGCLEFVGVYKQSVSRFSDFCEKSESRIF